MSSTGQTLRCGQTPPLDASCGHRILGTPLNGKKFCSICWRWVPMVTAYIRPIGDPS